MLNPSPRYPAWQRAVVVCGLVALVASAAMATPNDGLPAPSPAAPAAAAAADPVSRFLSDKGLIGVLPSAPSATAFVTQVREKAADMVMTAMNFLGVPYRRGGNNAESGFDCSGFTRLVFEKSIGLILPRRADEQAQAAGLVAVERESLQPGDLVFFNTLRRTFSHVGIYIGDGKFIHSPRPGGEVRVEDMRFMYWAKRFTGARRAEPMLEAGSTAEASLPSAAMTRVSAPASLAR